MTGEPVERAFEKVDAVRRWPDAQFLYLGTISGPERTLVEAAGLPFAAVRTGRFRRYATWRNVTDWKPRHKAECKALATAAAAEASAAPEGSH